ncbi:class I SAM-dependent DNA methyltransferase [Tenacibaculum finnmarkense]|uniref:class I SAM-dependent DNA methyltransferase n=1 Tax=Tenacibaculum finnmarkense TaxID=2781243 RepID=UPI001EFB170B|nr:DNA methyltransferase [Tenacibaculum finnmarkense]MCG8754955.1 class I SAM-dependent DNA methyltransferase [Tenacibaculum finnmarkense]MCG8783397.1 class I SAM-dependent DNA methyltransferase [Tenacibaculum finnmarkense]
MTSNQVEKNLTALVENFNKDEFVFDLLKAYGISKTSITRLKKGDFNLSKEKGEVLYKSKLFFKEVASEEILHTIDELTKDVTTLKHNPRFVIVTDYKTLLAKDTRTNETLDINILEIHKHYGFFLPWAGQEKYSQTNENYADRKASYKMAKLYDILVTENPNIYEDGGHNLNIFLSRLLFCFFAEDTGIFPIEGMFTETLAKHTQKNSDDVSVFLNRLFKVLNTEDSSNEAVHFAQFPYVNGGLFKDAIVAPKFNKKARQIILECGDLDWSEINPDIFGSMIQAVVNPKYRSGLGMHYTSVPNIMKVIEPLFLNELYAEFEKYKGNPKKLQGLIRRISKLKIFDPACGSGNFLIIAYKELRKLEIEILREIDSLKFQHAIVFTEIKLSQFYGIELDDFAHEMAILSLWLAEHQMNQFFVNELQFGESKPILPLKEAGHITQGNATRLDWEATCPKNEGDEIYILGNPPYLGSRNQDKLQKEEMKTVFYSTKKNGKLDYIACWFLLGSNYIKNTKNKYAFVSTNSICQGEQVPILWPLILGDKLEIQFTYPSFKWTNNAKGGAGVTVVIIGVGEKNTSKKTLYLENNLKNSVKQINPYLAGAPTIFVHSKSKPINSFPIMVRGNYTGCCNSLIMSFKEKEEIINEYPDSKKYIKPLIGSSEFISGVARYCLWIPGVLLSEANQIKPILDRINQVKEVRLKSTDKGQNNIADKSHQFREFNETTSQSVIVPVVSSERRNYIPCGFINSEEIVPNSAQVIYDCETWIFGVVSSRIHMNWVNTVAGRLRGDYRYSSSICYNTFPFPKISIKQKEQINLHVFAVLEARENYSEKTLAQLYDPEKMPKDLKEAHHQLDLAIERCYRLKPFTSDTERLEYLFKLYEKMIAKNTLLEKPKRTRKVKAS